MSDWAADSVTRRKVSELIPYDRNPRIHPTAQINQLAESIKEWGWTMPILIDEGANVIAGHGRLYAARELNIEEVPCVTALGWSDDKKKAYVIADNKLSEGSDWNYSLMGSELRDLMDSGFNLDLTGISDTELQIFSGNESDDEFNFSIDSDIENASGSNDLMNGSQPKKSDEGYVEFALVMKEENKRRLINRLNEIKVQHGAESNEDSMMILVG